jgi:Acetyltransferase (GNAT) domain
MLSAMQRPGTERCINSVFQRDWWLNAVAPGNWRYLTVGDADKPNALLPIVTSRRLGLKQIKMPVLTFLLGPGMAPSDGGPTTRISQEIDWLNGLIDQLPPFDYFCQNFHFSQQLATPFRWRNFDVSVLHTYTIENLHDLDAVWNNYRSSTRSQIRKAQKLVEVISDPSLADIWSLTVMSFARRGREPAFNFELFKRLHAAAEANNACKGFIAKDAAGRLHASIYIVWDEHSAYYLVGGADPEHRNSGAMSLLMHEAIKFSASKAPRFDFQGCNLESFEVFKRNFGGSLKSMHQVRGYSRRMRAMNAAQTLLLPASG